MILKSLTFLMLALSLSCGAVTADQCGPYCHCGCKEGKPCTCATPQGFKPDGKDVKGSSDACGPYCHCGCKEGKACTCPAPQGFKPDSQSNAPQAPRFMQQQELTDGEDYASDYSSYSFDDSRGNENACCEACACGQACTCGDACDCTACPGSGNSWQEKYNTYSVGRTDPPWWYTPCRAPGQDKIGVGIDIVTACACGKKGVWFPDDPPLYRNMMADPRQICYSAGWRFNDRVTVKNAIDVSFGDTIPFYRWICLWGGQLQLGLDGAVWALFDPLHDSSPLIDADYYGGLSLQYGRGPWSYRLRGYHISTHIGDEFMLDHPGFDRRNPSAEFIDFFASYDWTDQIRLYAGLGYVVAQDNEFRIPRWWTEWGSEFRVHGLGFTSWCNQLYGEPILGMHFRYRSDFKHHLDQTYIVGYEVGKLTNGRKMRLFAEYHDGYSLEGQFCKKPTHYFSIRISYGY